MSKRSLAFTGTCIDNVELLEDQRLDQSNEHHTTSMRFQEVPVAGSFFVGFCTGEVKE